MFFLKESSILLCMLLLLSIAKASNNGTNHHRFTKRMRFVLGRIHIKGSFEVTINAAVPTIGTRQNPAKSCKAILDDNRSAKSGVYYIKTKPSVTKVYCYMEDLPGCGGGGWTTIMKTGGYKKTFEYKSSFWNNKKPYQAIYGQSGVDNQETKLPTYWTLQFNSLCLGMKTSRQKQPKWIRLTYKANSLYSVIADGKYRSFSLGRSLWKSLIAGSSLQRNCNRQGFNVASASRRYSRVRIGIISNDQNDCASTDSVLGFGTQGNTHHYVHCRATTGNCGWSNADNGDKKIAAHGIILGQ